MWLYIICGLLLLFCAFLLFQHFYLRKDVRKMRQSAEDIRRGNFNMRFRLRTARNDMVDLSAELNRLIDCFQDSLARTRFLEEERQRMISNISHDLRTPLTSLLGYIGALRKDESLTEQERIDYLRIVSEKGGDLFKLIQEFFELARLEEEQEELPLQKVDIAELARTVLLDFYIEFTKLNITPITYITEQSVFVNGNTDALHRVLQNLISNSLRYGTDGKEIGVTVRETKEMIWVDVWDNGKGITPENLPHIFERLYTPETSRNATLRGTGLGLTIAKTLIEKQGGQIKVESVPNKKTIFSIGLPPLLKT